jgi:hypothetical protein
MQLDEEKNFRYVVPLFYDGTAQSLAVAEVSPERKLIV